jgi:hypothetical protein
MRATAPVTIDGHLIGYVTVGDDTEVSPDPLGTNGGLVPAPTPSQMPRQFASREYPSQDFAPSPGAHATPSRGNQQQQHRHLGHPHAEQHHEQPAGPHEHHRRFLTPENRGNQERQEQQRNVPLPKERPEKPVNVPHGDAAFGGPPAEKIRVPRSDAAWGGVPGESTFARISRGDGVIDRSHHRAYLEAHPELREKILSIIHNEQGENPEGTQAVAEENFNRADVRGHSLEQVSRWYGREPGGYYAPGNTARVTNPRTRAILEESLEKALSGSNISGWATDNSSGGLAAREKRGGEFTLRSEYGPRGAVPDGRGGAGVESFFTRNSENAKHKAWREQQEARSARNPLESTTDAPRPNGPAAPAHISSYHDDLEKNRQKNREAVERARHFSNEPLTPEKQSSATEPPHGSPL